MRVDTPVYLQVADDLAREIARAAAGTALPSETELARARGVHRQTARAALEELERRYLVRRAHGRRSLVARRLDYRIGPDTPPSWTETIRRAGATPALRTEFFGARKPPSWVRERLAVSNDACVLLLKRRRYVDGELAGCANSWIVGELVPDLQTRLADGDSLHLMLEAYALKPQRSWTHAEFVIASPRVAKRLGDSGRPMVLQLRGQTDSACLTRPIEITISWLRPDVFRVIYETNDVR